MFGWTPQLTRNIANAIAASANVSTSSVVLQDVRPLVAGSQGARRRLAQVRKDGGGDVAVAAWAGPVKGVGDAGGWGSWGRLCLRPLLWWSRGFECLILRERM